MLADCKRTNEGEEEWPHESQPLPSGGGSCKAEGKAGDRDHAPGRVKPGEAALLMVEGVNLMDHSRSV